MRRLRWFVVAPILMGSLACGEDGNGMDDGGSRDAGSDAHVTDAASEDGSTAPSCDLWRDPSNCWPTAATSLYECVPDEEGVLSEDRTVCNFSDGTRIEFARALPTFLGNYRPDFTVRGPGGDVCGTFFERDEETENGVESIRELMADGVVARFVQVPPVRGTPTFPESTLTLYCNDAEFLSGAFPDVLECAFMGVELPGWTADFDEERAVIGVSADSTTGALFECVIP